MKAVSSRALRGRGMLIGVKNRLARPLSREKGPVGCDDFASFYGSVCVLHVNVFSPSRRKPLSQESVPLALRHA